MDRPTEDFDYVVVGGGTAGCVVAARLSEDARATVCVLEAGPRENGVTMRIPAGFMRTLANPRLTWRFQTAPGEAVNGRSILIRQGRVVGGTSAINGMVYVRGQAADYDGWAARGNPGWSFREVLPYFRRSERYIGLHGDDGARGRAGPLAVTDNDWTTALSDAFIEAAVLAGIPRNPFYNLGDNEGVGYYERTISRGWRSAVFSSFLQPRLRRGNVQLRESATASRVLFEGRRATGVVYLTRRGGPEAMLRARREIILCAGAVNTPKILQFSGVGPAELLRSHGIAVRRDLPGVGRNFRDHFSIRVAADVRPARTVNEAVAGMSMLAELGRWISGRPSVLAISPALIYAFIRSAPTVPRADIQCFFTPGSFDGPHTKLAMTPGVTCGLYGVRPRSAGFVAIASTEPFDDPVLQPNYLADEQDRAILVAGVRRVREIYAQSPMHAFALRETSPGRSVTRDAELVAFARETGVTSHHLIGTARMGPRDDPTSVVDAALRVHGLQGLRVADASVMPEMPTRNTLAPILMIAERAADFIREAASLASGRSGG